MLDVWREACRNMPIAEGIAASASDLFARLPVDFVLVRRLDSRRQSVETVATGVCHSGPLPGQLRSELMPEAWERLLEWCAKGQIVSSTSAFAAELPEGLLPHDLLGEAIVGPLGAAEEPIGLVAFVSHEPNRLQSRHERLLRLLLEPFTLWLENDQRLREVNALREAAEAENRSLLSRLGRHDISDLIIGAQTGLKAVMERVEQVSRTDVPVLIFGETGSGKEVVARAIHQRSRRASGPFHRVNCGAIPPELVDSELFGHERGSFTGAVSQRKGWFERADGGTLFLDECGELSLAAQVRLLRVLQDGTFERVGGSEQVTVDVRLVAATHRDLRSMTAENRFREDLWYRLAVFPIRLPPLRDRTQDIPVMSRHFAERAAQRLGVRPLFPSAAECELLASYSWPGNVRELAAVIERAVILGDGKRLEVAKALGPPQLPPVTATAPQGELPEPGPEGTSDDFATLDKIMACHIEAALRRSHGRIEGPFGAAKLLQINPHTLRGRMRSLGVDWRRFRANGEIGACR